jgi:hypothetical protein
MLAHLRLSLFVLLAGCTLPETNFSQWPGWSEYLASHPAQPGLPDADQRALLEQHRPRFFLPPGHVGLIDFYSDYVAQGELRGDNGKLISERVTPALLNAHKQDPKIVFTHRVDPSKPAKATVYGRLQQANVALTEGAPRRFTFLTYHAVFRHSGVPAGFDGWRAAALSLIADLDDWHQLDHYTAATVVLDETQSPVALMLQQHNYPRTYVFGEAVLLSADGRPLVDVAIRSNELFPHAAQRMRRRAVRFMSVEDMRYMLGFGEKPSIAADDITEGADEAAYTLAFLPPDDAFYTFKGFLGARRRLPGRDGPPGADYNTLPEVKPLGLQLLSGYWREGNSDDRERFEASYARTGNRADFARAQGPAFAAALASGPP